MVGVGRFELPTSRSRTEHSSLAELHPDGPGMVAEAVLGSYRFVDARAACVSSLLNRQHPLQRELCVRRDIRRHDDLVDHVAFDERFRGPQQVRRVDAVHR